MSRRKAALSYTDAGLLPLQRIWWLAAAAALLAIVAHWPVLHGSFVYDDQVTVVENPSLRHPDQLLALLLYSRFRPVVNLSYALNYAIGELAPAGYHLFNLLLHALNAALLFFLARSFFLRGRTPEHAAKFAFSAAALFAVHPALTQAVAYVSGRAELLCGFFMLLGLISLLRAVDGGGARWWVVGIAAQLLAIASKEPGVMLAPLVLLHAWLWPGEDGARRRRANRVLLPVVALLAAAAIARAAFFVAVEHRGGSNFSHLALEAVVFWKYVQLFFVPYGQALVHSYPPVVSLAEPQTLASVSALGLGLWLSWKVRRSAPVISWAAAAFGLCLLPAAVAPLLEPMSEHRAYIADAFGLIALVQAVVLGLGALEKTGRAVPRELAGALLALVLVVFAALSTRQDRLWSDPVLLWKQAADVSPDVWAAQYAKGDALRQAGDCEHAIFAYRRAIVLIPSEVRAYDNLAMCLAQLGRYRETYATLGEALRVEPRSSKTWANLAALALTMHYPRQAAIYLRRGVELEPADAARRGRLEALENALHEHPSDEPAWPPEQW
jgi:tetratricopeptide (TPR) repeat protein